MDTAFFCCKIKLLSSSDNEAEILKNGKYGRRKDYGHLFPKDIEVCEAKVSWWGADAQRKNIRV